MNVTTEQRHDEEVHFTSKVIDAYRLVLGRNPDQSGLESHVDALKKGEIDEAHLYRLLLISEEARSITPDSVQAGERSRIASTVASIPPISLSKQVFFDVQDLLNFLHHHNSLTGIQRVVSGIIKTTLSLVSERSRPIFSMIGERLGEILIVDQNRLHYIVDIAMKGGFDQESLRQYVVELKESASVLQPRPDDVFFIGGAYWIVPDFCRRLNFLRSIGVTIGTYVYDLIPITDPQWVTDATRLAVTERAIDIILLSDFFFTISDFVKYELSNLISLELGFSKPIVSISLPHSLPLQTQSSANCNPRIALLDRFVLCVGTLEGRKNHILLMRVWATLIRKYGFAQVPSLVLVGKWGWNIERFREACSKSEFLHGKIILFENVGDNDLISLYEECMFTVFPSFVEGWGLPVGESLTARKLCVASNTSSIPEVGRHYCDYFNPHSFFEAYKVIERAIFDKGYLMERTLGIEKFEGRTWTKYVDLLLSALEDSASSFSGRKHVRILRPVFANEIYSFSSPDLIFDETVNWGNKALRFSLCSGWGSLEPWGVWAGEQRSSFAIELGTLSSLKSVLMLELRSKPGLSKGRAEIHVDGIMMSEVFLNDHPKWCVINLPEATSPVHMIEIRSDFMPLEEPHRKIYFGLSRLALLDSNEQSAFANLETAIGLIS